jgi:hypothetical protein
MDSALEGKSGGFQCGISKGILPKRALQEFMKEYLLYRFVFHLILPTLLRITMIVRKLSLIVVLLFALAGCKTTENYQKILRSWVGVHSDRLIMNWGPPTATYPLSNGGKVLEYNKEKNFQMGGDTISVPQTTYHSGNINTYGVGNSQHGTYSGSSTTYVQQTTPVHNITWKCVTRFTVNEEGIITSWAHEGNHCKAFDPED